MKNFDHSKAYEEGGIMYKKIMELLNLAREHGCPLLICAGVKKEDDGMYLSTRINTLDGKVPPPMDILAELIQTDSEDTLHAIHHLLELDRLANEKVEEVTDTVLDKLNRGMINENNKH